METNRTLKNNYPMKICLFLLVTCFASSLSKTAIVIDSSPFYSRYES